MPGKFLNRRSREFLEIVDQIRRNHVGGLILFAGNVYESAILLNDLQRESKLPLIVAADFERGASFRIADTTSFPWTMAVGATGSEELAYQEGVITGREARALGVTWVYAPVLDVNSNPDNPVINVRSYGEDPNLVARLGAAFIRGCREQGVLTTAKHFVDAPETGVHEAGPSKGEQQAAGGHEVSIEDLQERSERRQEQQADHEVAAERLLEGHRRGEPLLRQPLPGAEVGDQGDDGRVEQDPDHDCEPGQVALDDVRATL